MHIIFGYFFYISQHEKPGLKEIRDVSKGYDTSYYFKNPEKRKLQIKEVNYLYNVLENDTTS